MNQTKKAYLRGEKKASGMKGKTVLGSKGSLWKWLQDLVVPEVAVFHLILKI